MESDDLFVRRFREHLDILRVKVGFQNAEPVSTDSMEKSSNIRNVPMDSALTIVHAVSRAVGAGSCCLRSN